MMFRSELVLLCTIVGCYIIVANAQNGTKHDERNLWKYLSNKLAVSSADIRPVLFADEVLTVQIAPVLNSIVLIDEISELITVSVTMLVAWQNPDLVWTDTNANFSDSISIPCNNMWLPVVIMEKTVSLDQFPDPQASILICDVHHDGTVSMEQIQVQTSTCQLDIFAYPFDTQECFFSYTVWGYTDGKAKVAPLEKYHSRSITLKSPYFEDLPEWHILDYEPLQVNAVDAEGFETTEVRYKLTLKRIPTHSLVNVVLPTYVIFMLSIFGLFSPSDGTGEARSEKISMGLTCLLTMSVLLLVVSDSLPKTKSGSMLGFYLIVEFVLSMLATMVATKLVYANTHLDNKPVPWWISCLACMKHEEADEKLQDDTHEIEFRKLRNMVMSRRNSAAHQSKFQSETLELAYVYNENITAMLLDQCLKHFIFIRKIKDQLQTDGDIYGKRIKQLARVEFIMLILFLTLNTVITVLWLSVGNLL